MSGLFMALYIICGLVCFVCWIMVLIKQFQIQGVLHGILGIICNLYTFIWGWMHANELNIRKIMLIWTGGYIGTFIFYLLASLTAQ